MENSNDARGKGFTAFHSAAEEAGMHRDEAQRMNDTQLRADEGGHMSSTGGRVIRRPGTALPYIVELAHHGSDATRHAFATMREAEAYIKRNTPVPGRTLSAMYDRPAPKG